MRQDVFNAIASPTRRALLIRMRARPQAVTSLARALGLTLSAVSQQVRVLRQADLVHRQRLGRQQMCTLNARPLKTVVAWLRRVDDGLK